MDYVYAVMWFVVGGILIFSLSKENKIFYFAGGFFMLLGAWWLANALLPGANLFAGGWGIALKVITGAALLVLVLCFIREYRKKGTGAGPGENTESKKKDGK